MEQIRNVEDGIVWSDEKQCWIVPQKLFDEITTEFARNLDRDIFQDGSGTLDCVTSHGFFHRLALSLFGHNMNRKKIFVNNASVFCAGQTGEIYPVMGGRPRGPVVIAFAKDGRFWEKPSIEFESEVPEGTRRGDILVIHG